ncbi:uncharacterized protein LOC124374757, partial [Homalodisca vitripennis]|uniref:uncharacterized protein LOC124374757 n=1 Tax=Homalodisca vitripennis TaxID=197043 RepID=UPI001EE9F50E
MVINLNENTLPLDLTEDTTVVVEMTHEQDLNQNEENESAKDKGFTKKGQPRKRSAPKEKETRSSKQLRLKEKHGIKPACDVNRCKMKCIQKITEERRKSIYEQFWSLDDSDRKMFILSCVTRKKVARRTTVADGVKSRRNKSF